MSPRADGVEPVAVRLLVRLQLSGLAIPDGARVKLLRPPKNQPHQWRWRLERPAPGDRWEELEPTIGSMATPTECVSAPRLRIAGDVHGIAVYPEPELEPIPSSSKYQCHGTDPRFVTWKNEWCLFGPDWTLPQDRVITVQRYNDQGDSAVLVGPYLAERFVHRRLTGVINRTAGPARVRYVIAAIARDKN